MIFGQIFYGSHFRFQLLSLILSSAPTYSVFSSSLQEPWTSELMLNNLVHLEKNLERCLNWMMLKDSKTTHYLAVPMIQTTIRLNLFLVVPALQAVYQGISNLNKSKILFQFDIVFIDILPSSS